MEADQFEELFAEGWREPSGDAQRLMVYVLMGIGVFVGLPLCVFGIYGLANVKEFAISMTANPEHPNPYAKLIAWLFIVVGALLSVGSAAFLVKESRRWKLKGLNAERLVAGGMLLGVAVILFSFEFLGAAPGVGDNGLAAIPLAVLIIGAGVAIMLLFLIVGLICAYWPKRGNREEVRVLARFALDKLHNDCGDHPCPWEIDCVPVVRVSFLDGHIAVLRCRPAAYEFASSGALGIAFIRGKVLESFKPLRGVRR
jgi:hypothetical protein